MRGLKLAFAWCFAVVALLGLWGAFRILTAKAAVYGLDSGSLVQWKFRLILVPLVFGVPFAAAWWNILRQRPSARKWAIIASSITLLFGILMVAGLREHVLNPAWIAIIVGVAGVVLFSRRDPQKGRTPGKTVHSPLPGDGTNAVLNVLIHVIGVAAAFAGSKLLAGMARSSGLPQVLPSMFLLKLVLAIALVLIVHEAGHAIAGVALGMKLVSFAIGPFHWWRGDGRWKFFFRPGRFLIGQTLVVPSRISGFRRNKILQVAAGPAASIAAGMLSVAVMLESPGHAWASEWTVLAAFANISTLAGVLNLIPFGIGSGYSDGAKLYQLISAGLWADYQCLLAVSNSIYVTPFRPRDYDIATIERAAGTIAKGMDELTLHLNAYGYYLDSGRFAEAAAALARAESFCKESALEPPSDWNSVFVFGIAFLRQDAVAARSWWDRMEASEGFRPEKHWSSRCALLWSEDRLDEACRDLEKASAWADQLPQCGAAETEKYVVGLLRKALDQSLSDRPTYTAAL
jgi:hypothetical protein